MGRCPLPGNLQGQGWSLGKLTELNMSIPMAVGLAG